MQKDINKKCSKTDNMLYFLFGMALCIPIVIDYIANGNCGRYLTKIIPMIIAEILTIGFFYKIVEYIKSFIESAKNDPTYTVAFVIVIYLAIICFIYLKPDSFVTKLLNILGITKETSKEIITPIAAAFITGLMTLLGVRYTIVKQYELRAEDKRLAVKPYIFAIPFEKPNIISSKADAIYSSEFMLLIGDYYPEADGINIYLKNTDNGIAIIDRIYTSKKQYELVYGDNIINKNDVRWIKLLPSAEDIFSDFYMVVKDVYENEYTYKVEDKGKFARIKEIRRN